MVLQELFPTGVKDSDDRDPGYMRSSDYIYENSVHRRDIPGTRLFKGNYRDLRCHLVM